MSYDIYQKTPLATKNRKPPVKAPLVKITLWANPLVKAEIKRIAEREGLSVSKVGALALEEWVHQQLHLQHAVLLETIIDKAIGKHMRAYSKRLAVVLVRSLFSAEHARSFAYNLLGRQPGMTDEQLTNIKNGASNTARANITRITPQMKTLIEAVEQWLEEVEEEVSVSG